MELLEKNPLDIRVRSLNLKRGKIKRQDVEKHLSALPDDSEWAEEHVVYEEETETTEESPTVEIEVTEDTSDLPDLPDLNDTENT